MLILAPALQAAETAPKIGEIKPKPAVLDGMASLPSGEFQMGSPDGEGASDEHPRHKVALDAFRMDKHETTVAEYAACVKAGACRKPDTEDACNWGKAGREQHPVNCVSYDQAKAYCAWAGKRLPTEAEWEYAARSAGKDRKHPWGDDEAGCGRAVINEDLSGCGRKSTWPVCSKPAGNTEQGLCDMAGNVWEWVADWYDKGYYGKSPERNPRGPDAGQYRSLRGGAWYYDAEYLRASDRSRNFPNLKFDYYGFRCAK